jgi:two-component system, NtrC family, sensor kinase
MQVSLQGKLTLGYLIVAILTLAVSLYTFEKIRVVEQRILLGERVTELFDVAMEIRRFERNYFLHGQDADRSENAQYIDTLRELLKRDEADFSLLGVPERVKTLRSDLDAYQTLMAQYAQAASDDAARRSLLEPQIRHAGQAIVAVTEEAAASERRLVRSFLHDLRITLVFSIVGLALLMIGVGQALSRRVVLPLKRMVNSVEAAQRGNRDKLPLPSRDREIIAIINAFNQMLKELELRQKHLMRSEKLASLGTMLSGVAHELNNPLSNIWSSCQILLEELDEPDPDGKKKLLLQIDEQSERARVIVRSLLDFARDQQFNKEQVQLRRLIEQTVKFLKGEVPTKVKVVIDVPDDVTLMADRQRLQQALLNLIKNAVEAVGDEGEVSIVARKVDLVRDGEEETAFPVGCQVEGSAVDIIISDSGPGIPADVLPRIFDPFFTTKDVGRGMGLGLFIVYQIIDEHGGCIFAGNGMDRGAVFRIRLPLQTA